MLQQTTELEAINVMLTNIGESPVTTLNDPDVVDAGIARTILASVNREVQSMGWWFNIDIQREFVPTSSNRIQLPLNTLRVDTTGLSVEKNYVQRGRFLYDVVKHTFNITDPVTLDIVQGLDFDELPEVARRYITVRAARIFQERLLGTPTVSSFNMKDEETAMAALKSEHSEAADHNILHDSYSTSTILQRNYFTMR